MGVIMNNNIKQNNKHLNSANNAQNTQNKLQELLNNYKKNNNIFDLQKVANIIVKATLNNYAKYSNDGLYLKSQCKITNKLTHLQELATTNNNQINFDELHQAQQQVLKIENQDIKDLKQVVLLSLLDSITHKEQDNNIIIKSAYKNINKYLYEQRTLNIGKKRPFDYSLQYLTDNGIMLVNVRKNILAITKNTNFDILDNIYNISNFDNFDSEKIEQDRTLLLNIFAHLTPLQKSICKMLACGDSQRQIASKLNRVVSTINEHIKNIKKIANQIKQTLKF